MEEGPPPASEDESTDASLGMRFRARISFSAVARGKAAVEGRRRSSGIEAASTTRKAERRKRGKRESIGIMILMEERGERKV